MCFCGVFIEGAAMIFSLLFVWVCTDIWQNRGLTAHGTFGMALRLSVTMVLRLHSQLHTSIGYMFGF